MEGAAALANDTLLALDEVSVVDAKEAAVSIYQLAAGTGKSRLARDSSLRPVATWRVVVLSTGEIPMATKVAEDKGRKVYAGQQVRLLDILADAGRGFGVFDGPGPDGDPGELANAIKQGARTSYGTAGPEFVRCIVKNGINGVAHLIREMVAAFKQANLHPDADGQVQRAADRFALIGAAGELATAFRITPWQPGEAMRAAARAMVDWIEHRGGTDAAEVTEAIARVRHFIENHGESRFQSMNDDSGQRPVINRVGFRKGSGANRQWCVYPEAWKNDVCGGLDPTATARALAERGMLRPAPDRKFARSERTPEGNNRRVYVITAEILEGGND